MHLISLFTSRLLEVLSRSFLPKGSLSMRGFLQKERPEEQGKDDDEESVYSDNYYGDSDNSDEEDAENTIHPHEKIDGMKPDVKLIRVILKTMANLLQASTLQIFSQSNRLQLVQYLTELRIGSSADDIMGIALEDIARKDRVVEVYYSILLEQTNAAAEIKSDQG